MKKLMFATALVASAAAFADPINATSFEGYTANESVLVNKGDTGESGGSGNYFCFTGGDADGSVVKTFGGENLTAPGTRTAYYASAASNANYLELSTEGGTLWRSINTITGSANAYDLGAATNVAANGTYFDSLVQFTPTEDGGGPTDLDAADKLAIWLNVDEQSGATNLMVRAKYWYLSGEEPAYTVTNFTVSGASVVAGEWYRLTVRAVPALTTYSGCYIPAFQIFIDGISVAATEAQLSSELQSGFTGMWATGMQELVAANKMFPSLAPTPASIEAVTLQGVGFKGSGAIDDIVWTEENPFAGSGAAWIDEVTNIFVGATLDATEKAKIAAWASSNNITVASGSEELAAAAYLLNLTSLPAGIPDLTITSIEEGESAWTLTVAASVNDTALALPAQINGAVMLKQSATLAGLDSANAATATFTIANGTATVTVDKDAAAAKFMKVSVGIAPPAN